MLANHESIDELVETFTTTLKDEINDAIPNKTVLIWPNDKPGMTGQVRRLFRQCHRLHKIAMKSKQPEDIEKHRAARRIAKCQWKFAQQNYYDKLYNKMASSDNKTKYYWKLTKSLYGQSKSQTISTPPLQPMESILMMMRTKHEYWMNILFLKLATHWRTAVNYHMTSWQKLMNLSYLTSRSFLKISYSASTNSKSVKHAAQMEFVIIY